MENDIVTCIVSQHHFFLLKGCEGMGFFICFFMYTSKKVQDRERYRERHRKRTKVARERFKERARDTKGRLIFIIIDGLTPHAPPS